MDFHIEDTETEKLAAEVAEMTGTTKTDAVREALREKKERLEMRAGGKPKRDLREFFEREIWPLIPEEERRQPPLTKKEEEDLLGYSEEDEA